MDQTDTGDSSRASGHRQNYDVFLSHSGKQRNFVRQLYRDLRNQGLSCFFDEDPECLPVGADIHSSISEAVRACRVAVLILSKEYLEAKSSMEELSAFVEARDIKCTNPDLKIIPLFFLIPPSALRAIRKGNENWEELGILWKTQVKWIDALHAIPDNSGVIFRVGDDEKEIRDFIVEQIQNILSKHMQLRVSYPRYHVRGMQGEARMCQAVADFFIDVPPNEKGILIAGLYGRAGVGKTSLGRAFCNFKLVEFVGRVCHLDFSRGDPLHRTKLALQYLAECRPLYVQTLTSRDQALAEFYRRVWGQRLLLVLDNITQESVEEVVSYLKADLGKNSWILFSARSLDNLLTHFKFDAQLRCMPVPRLDEEEAIAILLERASAAQEMSTLGAEDRASALKCAERCLFRDTKRYTRESAQTFHPVALKVLGSYLFSKYGFRLSHWIDQIDATVDLKGDSFDKVFAVLGSAFNFMSSDYRDIFMRLTVYMLPDMSPDKVKNWLAISCHKEIQFIEQAVMHLVEMGFIGEFNSEILVDNICMEFAQRKANKMERWLWWKDYHISTRGIITPDRDGFVSAKFEKCMYRTIPSMYQLVELQLIDVKDVQKLDLHRMGRLRSITLRNCMHVEGFYGMENLEDLAWLQIIGVHAMFTLPQLTSLGSLQYLEINIPGSQVFDQLGDLSHCLSLREINVVCPSLLDFPSLEGMGSLEKVEFSLCDKVKGPLNCTDCVMLQTIVLNFCRQMTASPVFSGSKNLSKLVLHECDAVTVCTDVDEPNALKTLELFISSKAASLPTNLESCCELEDLQLWNMWDLMELPSFKRLSNLTVLKLGKCGIRDPPDLTGCGRLQDVYFFKLRNLEKLPNFSSLKELKKLSLSDCSSVQDPPNIEGCHQLQVFHLLYNDNMKGISKMDKCAQLEEIQVSWHSENEVAYEGIDPNSCQVDEDLEFSLEHFTDEKFGKIGDVSDPEELKQLQWLKGKTMLVKRYFRGVKLYYSVTLPYEDAPRTYCSKSSITLKVIDGKVRPFMRQYKDYEYEYRRWFNEVREYFAAKEDIARASASSDFQQVDSSTSIEIVPQVSQASSNSIKFHPDIKHLVLQSEAYCPKRVALGVCNHGESLCLSETSKENVNMVDEKMKALCTEENVNMVDEKMKALCTTANRLKEGQTVEYLVEEIEKLGQEIVDWYNYNGNLTGDILAWNFAMDACFILEFFRASYRFKNLSLEREIMMDIFKMENQIPLFILRKILELEFGTPQKAISQLASLMCMRPRFAILPFSLKFMESKDLQTEIEENIKKDPCHLLQLLSRTIEASLQLSDVPIGESGVEFVSDLADVILAVARRDVDIGDNFLIRFKPSRNGQIQFKKGWFGSCALYLPQIYLSEETEPLFWNLIAFASTSENNIIGNFIFFMNWIISFHKKSIVALKEKKLIISGKDNAELSEMFSKLSLTVCKSIGPFGKIQKQIEEHHNSSFSKWMIRSRQSICLLFQFPLIGLILVLAFVVSIFFTR